MRTSAISTAVTIAIGVQLISGCYSTARNSVRKATYERANSERAEEARRKREAGAVMAKKKNTLVSKHVYASRCEEVKQSANDYLVEAGKNVKYSRADHRLITHWDYDHQRADRRVLVKFEPVEETKCRVEAFDQSRHDSGNVTTERSHAHEYRILGEHDPEAKEEIDRQAKQAYDEHLEKSEEDSDGEGNQTAENDHTN